jgi:hypothetical protein
MSTDVITTPLDAVISVVKEEVCDSQSVPGLVVVAVVAVL